jgi:uncharacterized membrane protein
MAIFFALLTLIGWGVGDVFVTIASRRIGNRIAYFWGMVFSIILSSIYIPLAGPINDIPLFLLAALLGFVLAFGTMFYLQALEVGNASIAGAIGGSFAVLTVILSMIFFGEKISLLQGIGILLTAAGIILASLQFSELKEKRLNNVLSDKSIPYVLIAVIISGFYYCFIRIPVEKIGWFWGFYPTNYFFLFFLLSAKIRKGIFQIFKDKKTLIFVILFMTLILIAQFSYNLGILSGYTSIVAPIAGSYPVLFVLLTRLVFKEKLTKQQTVGIISSLLGIIMISLSSH